MRSCLSCLFSGMNRPQAFLIRGAVAFSDEEKLYAEGGRALKRLPREVMESPSLKTFKTHQDMSHGPDDPAWSGDLDWKISRGLLGFQP